MKAPTIGTFADCATGIDEEMMNKETKFQINHENSPGDARYQKQAFDGGHIIYATSSPLRRESNKCSSLEYNTIDNRHHAPPSPSQLSSAMRFSPQQTPTYGPGLFALKKRSMLTKRNLLQKLDNDFQSPNLSPTGLEGSKLNVDLCLGLTYSPKLKLANQKPGLTALTKENINKINKTSNLDL